MKVARLVYDGDVSMSGQPRPITLVNERPIEDLEYITKHPAFKTRWKDKYRYPNIRVQVREVTPGEDYDDIQY